MVYDEIKWKGGWFARHDDLLNLLSIEEKSVQESGREIPNVGVGF